MYGLVCRMSGFSRAQLHLDMLNEWTKVFKHAGHEVFTDEHGAHCEVCGASLIDTTSKTVEVWAGIPEEGIIRIFPCPQRIDKVKGEWISVCMLPTRYNIYHRDPSKVRRFTLIDLD